MWTLADVQGLFELADATKDFCITEEEDKTICGGWNRVYLYPNGTIKVSGTHSSMAFLEIADQLGIDII